MKQFIPIFSVMVSGIILIYLFTAASITAPSDEVFIIPDSVRKILEKSCIECHNSRSKNKRALKKLDFDELNNIKTYQIIGKMVNVAEVVVNNDMPPRRFIKKYPGKALTYKDRQIIVNWVNELTAQPRQALVTLDSQLEDLVIRSANFLYENQKSNLAVLEFFNQEGNFTKLGRYISDELTTRLFYTEGLKVKERHAINNLLLQNQMVPTDTITGESAKKLGEILDVDAIIYGTIADLPSSVRLSSRLISSDSGQVISEISVDIPKDEKVGFLLSEIIEKPFDLHTPKKSTKPKSVEPAPLPFVEKGGFIFELVDASVVDSTLLCRFKVTNPGDNHKDFRMRAWFKEAGNTVAIDDSGKEYYISAAKFDGKLVKEMFNVHKTIKTIYAGTTLNLEISFKDENSSPKNATKISSLKIISEIEPWFTVEFRNIPLKKK